MPALYEPETPKEAEKSQQFWNWIKSNKLYRSTEFGGLHYITISDSNVEVVFWYICFFACIATCVFHLRVTSLDLVEQTLVTKIYALETKDEDFDRIKSWTLCTKGELGSNADNAPNWDIRYIVEFAKQNDSEELMDQWFRYIDYRLFTIGRREQGSAELYHRHYYLLRKYIQIVYRYSFNSANLNELTKNLDSTHYLDRMSGAYVVVDPANLWLRMYDHADDILNSSSLLSKRVEFVRACNQLALELKNLTLGELHSKIDYSTEKILLKCGLSIDESCELTPENNEININGRKDLHDLHNLFNCLQENDTDSFERIISDYEQILLADIIALHLGDESQEWFHGGDLMLSLKAVRDFVSRVEYRMANNSDIRRLFIGGYADKMRRIAKYADKIRQLSLPRRNLEMIYINEETECYRIPAIAKLSKISFTTNINDYKSFKFLEELHSEHTKWYDDGFVNVWATPDNPEPALESENKMYFNRENKMKLFVDEASNLVNTTVQECVKNQSVIFDCIWNCNHKETLSTVIVYGRSEYFTANQRRRSARLNSTVNSCSIKKMLGNSSLRALTDTFMGSILVFRMNDDVMNEFYSSKGRHHYFDPSTVPLECRKKCIKPLPACETKKFGWVVSDERNYIRKNDPPKFTLTIRYETVGRNYYVLEQEEKTDKWAWLATIGGVLELWLGAGLLSLLHFLLYFVKMAVRHLNRHLRNRGALKQNAGMLREMVTRTVLAPTGN